MSVVEEFLNHNHTPGRGHPNLGGDDMHIAREVAQGIRTGGNFKRSLGESQHYWQHKKQVEALPKRDMRKAHKHILKLANEINRAQNAPRGFLAAEMVEEFYKKPTNALDRTFTPAKPSAPLTPMRSSMSKITPKTPKGAAPKKPDTSNWHRDRVIKDELAKLHARSGVSTPKMSTPSASSGDKYKKNSLVKTNKSGGVPKPKYLKASAIIEEFVNHNHTPGRGHPNAGGMTMTTVGDGPSVVSGSTRLHQPMAVKFRGGGNKSNYATYRDAQGTKHQGGRFPKGGTNAEGVGRMSIADRLYTKLGYHATARAIEQTQKPGGRGMIHPRTGHEPTKGYAVAQSGTETSMPASKAFDSKGNHTPAFEKMIRDKISELPKGKNDYLGARHDSATGLIEVNHTRVYTSRAEALAAARGRGDSRPVSHEEFQRLAATGRAQLDAMRSGSSPTTGLDSRWEAIKSETYAKAQESWGGATIDSHTGVEVPQGAKAFALTVKDRGVDTVSVREGASVAEFNAAMDKAKAKFGPILERSGHHLGVFHDDENHRIDIDPVIVTPNHADVETIGAASHSIGGAYNFADGNGYFPPHVPQKSIYDIKNGKEIQTGGTGK